MDNLPTAGVRFPDDLVARAEQLVEPMGADPKETIHGKVSRSHVLRKAASLGLELLEARYATVVADAA